MNRTSRSVLTLLLLLAFLLSPTSMQGAFAQHQTEQDAVLAYEHSAKGYAHYEHGEYWEALAEYMLAMVLDPDQEVYSDWIVALQAIGETIDLPLSHPSLAYAYSAMGHHYYMQGEREKAHDQYVLAARLDPDQIMYYYWIIYLESDAGTKEDRTKEDHTEKLTPAPTPEQTPVPTPSAHLPQDYLKATVNGREMIFWVDWVYTGTAGEYTVYFKDLDQNSNKGSLILTFPRKDAPITFDSSNINSTSLSYYWITINYNEGGFAYRVSDKKERYEGETKLNWVLPSGSSQSLAFTQSGTTYAGTLSATLIDDRSGYTAKLENGEFSFRILERYPKPSVTSIPIVTDHSGGGSVTLQPPYTGMPSPTSTPKGRCNICTGAGKIPCRNWECNGGKVKVKRINPYTGDVYYEKETCRTCHGSEKETCWSCGGTGERK